MINNAVAVAGVLVVSVWAGGAILHFFGVRIASFRIGGGILILMINIIGGLSIGMGQHDLDLGTAVRFYALLTIGDGLVSQIPALVISTAAGIIVSRAAGNADLGSQLLADDQSGGVVGCTGYPQARGQAPEIVGQPLIDAGQVALRID